MRILSLIFLLLAISSCATTSVSEAFDDSRNASLAEKLIKASHPGYIDTNFEVTSFNGIVLITGQVPSPKMIPLATHEVERLRNVRKVHNELTVAGPTSMISRANDSWLTTKIKSSLVATEDTDASRIKVVTENGVVFMMGLLTRAEADAAVDITRHIRGVQKIVKLFEYMN